MRTVAATRDEANTTTLPATRTELRDWFAGMALIGLASQSHRTPEKIAADAFALAAAMLAERERKETR